MIPQYTVPSNNVKGILTSASNIPPNIAEYYGAIPFKQPCGFKAPQVDNLSYTHSLLCSIQSIVCFINYFFINFRMNLFG